MKVTQEGVHLKAALPSEIKSIPDGSGQGIIIYVLQKYRDENAAIRIQVAKSYYHRLYFSR